MGVVLAKIPTDRYVALPIIFRSVAQFGSAPALGAGGRWFESSHSDHYSRDEC